MTRRPTRTSRDANVVTYTRSSPSIRERETVAKVSSRTQRGTDPKAVRDEDVYPGRTLPYVVTTAGSGRDSQEFMSPIAGGKSGFQAFIFAFNLH